jgi:phenylpropionate dioxygenase-like ring-hydroxylating dioxygenase large terminal subunit
MLSSEENEILTRVGPGAPMGELFRRYWIPALLCEEIPEPDCPPVRVRLLGEDLVAFRDSRGRIGLLDEHCSHRGTSLFFGRNEECGLRCIYHGWKYDVEGNVLETPAEPPESRLKEKVKHTAYPCREGGGVVWTYMGPGDKMPLFPNYPWLVSQESQRSVFKSLQECNYLQCMEGDIDSSHSVYLHRRNVHGKLSPNAGELNFLREASGAPVFEVERRRFGLRGAAVYRHRESGKTLIRVTNFVMPLTACIPSGVANGKVDSINVNFQSPRDDSTNWRYQIHLRMTGPVREEGFRGEERDLGPDYRKMRNLHNRYLQDRARQKQNSYTGIEGFLSQDSCATETMGTVCDRTKEHLGVSDSFVIATRRYLLGALEAFLKGEEPPGLVRDQKENEFSDISCDVVVTRREG